MQALINLFIKFAKKGPVSLMVAGVLCGVVWIWGPKIHKAIKTQRVSIVLAIIAVWLVYYITKSIIVWQRNRRMRAVLAAQEKAAAAEPSNPAELLERRFKDARLAMKGTRLGTSALRSQPWFLVMGTPGSGKTAAVRESGLNFPYVGLGYRANPGAGATRDVDWWFSDRGVFLDVTGRYVSDQGRSGEWLYLLWLLRRKTRRERALNGVVVMVAIDELLALGEDRIADYAQGIRDRLDELATRLGLVLPVYLVFSKCDLLHGFTDFFSHYSLDDRAQVWGCTLDWDAEQPGSMRDVVDAECQRLYDALRTRRVEALSGERTREQQQNALLFPIQFATLQKRLGLFVEPIARRNPFQDSARLRGFYFASAAQVGTPVDQTMATLARTTGADGAEPTLQPAPLSVAEQKAYFLKALFNELLPGDAPLARPSRRRLLQHQALRAGLAVGALAAGAALAVLWWRGHEQGAAALNDLSGVSRRLKAAGGERGQALGALDDLRRRIEGVEGRGGVPLPLRLGMALGPNTLALARKAYLERFQTVFMRPFMARLEAELAARRTAADKTLDAYEELFSLHRAYLMLTGVVPVERELIDRVLIGGRRWAQVAVPADAADPGAAAVAANLQLDFVLEGWEPADWQAKPDRLLVDAVNRELREAHWIPLSSIDLVRSGATLYPAIGRSTLVAGKGADLITLDRELNGLYSQEGWNQYVARAAGERAQVLGAKLRALGIDISDEDVLDKLKDQYAQDYARAWRGVLLGAAIAPFNDLGDAVERLGILGSPVSPYRELFQSVWKRQAIAFADDDVRNAPADTLDWLDAGLKPVANLQVALGSYVVAVPAGTRLAKPAELDAVMAAFAAAESEALKGLEKSVDPDLRRAAGDTLRQALAFARQQLERELFAETVRSIVQHVQFDKGEALVTALGAVPSGYPERWQDLVDSASLTACGDLDEAVTRIALLASPQSPLRQLLRGAWQGQGTVGGRIIPAADWLDGCLAALATVQAECALLAAADPALRLGDLATLQKLADTVAKADQAITAALKPVDNPRLYNAARRLFNEVLESARSCVSARLGADADRLWKEGFHSFWSSHAHKFPFADTDIDLDPAVMGELLGARAGRLWAAAKTIEAAAAITVLGKPLVRTSEDWRAALTRAGALRDLLYAEGGDALLMPIAATFRQRAGVNDLRLTVGASSAGLYDSPHRRASLAWREDGPQSAQLQANVEDGRTLTVGVEGRPWAFLRLVKGGNPLPLPEGGVLLSWELRPVAEQADRRYLAQVVVEVPRFSEQLAAGLFSGLRFPAQVTPR